MATIDRLAPSALRLPHPHTVALTMLAALAVACGSEDHPTEVITDPVDAFVHVGSVTVSPSQLTVSVGESGQLTASILDTEGHPMADAAVTWRTSDAAVATVSADGAVSGIAAGSTTVIASSEAKSDTAAVTVSAPDNSSVFAGQVGCNAASALAALATSAYWVNSLGSATDDSAFTQEVAVQQWFWQGVPASVYLYSEGAPANANAFASPDGFIAFGYYFYHDHVHEHGELAIDGTLAHEWGHRAQQTFSWSTSVPEVELEADAFSGYYMAMVKNQQWSDIQGYYDHFFSIGDYNFNTAGHHGTPTQRLAAAYLGVRAAIEAVRQGHYFTYEELHQIFTTVIANDVLTLGSVTAASVARVPEGSAVTPVVSRLRSIALRDIAEGRSRGAEVTYQRLTASELEKLRPR